MIMFTASVHAAHYHTPHTTTPVPFKMSIIDAHASGSYGLIGHDITKNGYTDLISFAYTGSSAGKIPGEIYWYEFQGWDQKNETAQWKKHLITKKKHVVHGDFMDILHRGFDDLIFMSDFEVPITNEQTEGNIWWAKRPENLNDAEWKTYKIGQTAGAHRIVAADIKGSGSKAIVVVPLFSKGNAPMYGAADITIFEPGSDPTRPWNKTVFSNHTFHAMHDAIPVPKKNAAGENIIVASQEGLFMLSFHKNKQNQWAMDSTLLHATPQDNSKDIASRDQGTLKWHEKQPDPSWNLSGITSLSQVNSKQPMIAAIDYTKQSSVLMNEPWHGDTVSLYIPKKGADLFSKNGLQRQVLERRSAGGHAVQLADFTGKGCLDVVAGFRAYPTAFMLYQCKKIKTKAGNDELRYEKQIISERSANSIVIGHWNKNGLPDIATAGFGLEGDPYILMWTNQSRHKA